jgi:hypothetical protein
MGKETSVPKSKSNLTFGTQYQQQRTSIDRDIFPRIGLPSSIKRKHFALNGDEIEKEIP